MQAPHDVLVGDGSPHRRGLGVPVGDVGEHEPGQQTIELPRGPVRPRAVGIGLAAITVVTLVGVQLVGLWPELRAIVPGAALAVLGLVAWLLRPKGPTILRLRADALVVQVGKDRRVVAYADVVRVAAVRRAVHSELLLETLDGRIDRFPVRGFPVAATLEAAIVGAMARSGRQRESPDARQALDALRSGRAAEGA